MIQSILGYILAQIPTDVDVDTGNNEVEIWSDPLYVTMAVVLIVILIGFIIFKNRKK
ncbi:hypothetical protein [Salibacter sp.]|uniref:hypothetical protein n=1 Tax=Salibacter sp. TaxID=2010995 RepID=UPI002870A7B4|nr:hypothetical protein [Salibacter sp.]MDR9398986.1 hypothetical protein [Salibacter sp.]MDR9487069.1 hypothetical protein [Salibacter sp.]